MEPSFTAPQIAQLSREAVEKVRELEARLGDSYVVAYQMPLRPAELSPEQLEEVRRAEEELGVCLVAYRKVA